MRLRKVLNEKYLTGTGQVLRVHRKKDCVGPHCPIHNPSDHHMKDWPTHWRADRGIMERVCEHGVGHPDPDDAFADGVHGCDGCCTPPAEKKCPECRCIGFHKMDCGSARYE